jgi:hypothetical protein
MSHPLAHVKEKFGDKKKLIAAVEKFTGEELWVGRLNTKKGLAHVSNAKLIKLHATFSAVKEKFGTRFKLVDAILAVEDRAKDEGYRTHLLAFPVPRLWDMYKSADKRKAAKSGKPAPGEGKSPGKAAPPKAKAAPKAAATPKKKAEPKA